MELNAQERIERVARDHGLEAVDKGSLAWLLAYRVAQAMDAVDAAASAVMLNIGKSSVDVLAGDARTALNGVPLGGIGREAAEYDAAVVRLIERRDALRLLGEAVGRKRAGSN